MGCNRRGTTSQQSYWKAFHLAGQPHQSPHVHVGLTSRCRLRLEDGRSSLPRLRQSHFDAITSVSTLKSLVYPLEMRYKRVLSLSKAAVLQTAELLLEDKNMADDFVRLEQQTKDPSTELGKVGKTRNQRKERDNRSGEIERCHEAGFQVDAPRRNDQGRERSRDRKAQKDAGICKEHCKHDRHIWLGSCASSGLRTMEASVSTMLGSSFPVTRLTTSADLPTSATLLPRHACKSSRMQCPSCVKSATAWTRTSIGIRGAPGRSLSCPKTVCKV